jgi:8-oxo-dGTP pyrophosphatase MutT (NUDIX family)
MGKACIAKSMSAPSRLLGSFSPRRLALRMALGASRLGRGMTLGVRGMLIRDGSIVLVRHSYVPGWYFPGGGVEAGESLYEALERELHEEAGVVLSEPADLFGVYRNGRSNPRDHVALYVCRNWEQPEPPKVPNLEIRACEIFSLDDLLHDATPGTRARIAEVSDGLEPVADW